MADYALTLFLFFAILAAAFYYFIDR